MDNLGNEVIKKVKEAIRAKLKEMNVNSSDEIIDYIMLLVTTKKSSTELAKSIDFVMENNTTVFVKWLSTVIKKLQQVTISTPEKKISETLQIPTENMEKDQSDIIICESNDIRLGDSDEEKEELSFDLSVGAENEQIFDKEKNENCLHDSSPSKFNERKISLDNLNKTKSTNCSSAIEMIKTKDYRQINKTNISIKNDCIKTSSIVSKNSISNDNENDFKRKRPRITINSDDEDEKKYICRLPVTTKDTVKQISSKHSKQNKNVMSQVIVKSLETKKNINECKKKLFMYDLIAQRVDHQRGALALDTAFKYIQQQIGASDKDIKIIKKWRDYAVEMLRSNKKL